MAENHKIYAIFPVGGFGTRFAKMKFEEEKPFIECLGKTQIEWSIIAAKRNYPDCQIVIGSRSGLFNKFLELKTNVLDHIYGTIEILDIGESTLGAASTLEIILQKLLTTNQDFSFISLDNDVAPLLEETFLFFTTDVGLFTTFSRNPGHSYLISNPKGEVLEIAEKIVISNRGIIGNYYFSSAKSFLIEAERTQWNNNERYISSVANQYLRDGYSVIAKKCDQVISYGTPEEIEKISNNQMRILSGENH